MEIIHTSTSLVDFFGKWKAFLLFSLFSLPKSPSISTVSVFRKRKLILMWMVDNRQSIDIISKWSVIQENDLEKRKVKNFIRFGKRGDENYDGNDAQFQLGPIFPYKRFGRRRMSNFLRFGWMMHCWSWYSPITWCMSTNSCVSAPALDLHDIQFLILNISVSTWDPPPYTSVTFVVNQMFNFLE